MTPNDSRQFWLAAHQRLSDEAEVLRNSHPVSFGLLEIYDDLTPNAKETVHSVLADWLVSDDNRLQSDGTYTYLYDNEGHRTRRTRIAGGEVTDYQWDHRNRPIRVSIRPTDNGPLTTDISYTYDIFDRRLAKQFDLDGPGPQAPTKEFFLYDGEHIALTVLDPDTFGRITAETNAAVDFFYECRACGGLVPSVPPDNVGCSCGNIFVDVDYHRLAVRDYSAFEAVAKVRN